MNLEWLVGRSKVDELDSVFLHSEYSDHANGVLQTLDSAKWFIHNEWDAWKKVMKGTILDGTDCLTMSVVANLIARREGYETEIGRPTKLTHFYHAMIIYDLDGDKIPFKVAGKSWFLDAVPMTRSEIKNRLRVQRPIYQFVNRVRFRGTQYSPAYKPLENLKHPTS